MAAKRAAAANSALKGSKRPIHGTNGRSNETKGHQQGEAEVKNLAAHVEDQRLAAREVVLQLAEVCGQTDAHKGQAEKPAALAASSAICASASNWPAFSVAASCFS